MADQEFRVPDAEKVEIGAHDSQQTVLQVIAERLESVIDCNKPVNSPQLTLPTDLNVATEVRVDMVVPFPMITRDAAVAGPHQTCRICLRGCDGGPILDLECNCKQDLALVHKDCAEKWFQIRSEKRCEICSEIPRNATIDSPPLQAVAQLRQQGPGAGIPRGHGRHIMEFVELRAEHEQEREEHGSSVAGWIRYFHHINPVDFSWSLRILIHAWSRTFEVVSRSRLLSSAAMLLVMLLIFLALFGIVCLCRRIGL